MPFNRGKGSVVRGCFADVPCRQLRTRGAKLFRLANLRFAEEIGVLKSIEQSVSQRFNEPVDQPFHFFRRSAQRFFIIIDNRFLPAGVMPPRRFLFVVAALGPGFGPRLPPVAAAPAPTKAVIARTRRSLSFFRS